MENIVKQPTLYMLVGIPCSGKSTWVDHQDWTKDCAYISTDFYVERYAKKCNKTYDEVFKEYMPTAVKLMTNDVIRAREAGEDIIWDQTSTTVMSRKKKLEMLPAYNAIAIVFQKPDDKVLMKRLASRAGKNIPWAVVSNMIKGFQIPTKNEGFSEIWFAN